MKIKEKKKEIKRESKWKKKKKTPSWMEGNFGQICITSFSRKTSYFQKKNGTIYGLTKGIFNYRLPFDSRLFLSSFTREFRSIIDTNSLCWMGINSLWFSDLAVFVWLTKWKSVTFQRLLSLYSNSQLKIQSLI